MDDWVTQKLSDVCEKITDGTHQTPKYFDDGHIFLSSKNVTSGRIDWSNVRYIDDAQHIEMQKRISPRIGDILLAKNGTTGVAAIVDRDVCFDIYVSLAFLRPLEFIEPQFLLYFINSPIAKKQFNKRLKGMGVPNLHLKEIREVQLSYPPEREEQKRIVAILAQAFADIEQARAKAEQNLKNVRELFESYLQQVFSQRGEDWAEKSLKEASLDFGRGKSKHRPRNDDSLYGGSYPFIQTGDVRNCEHFITKYSKTYNDKGLAQSKLWPKGTICITIAANIAETGIMDFDGCFPDSVIGVVVNPEITMVSYVEYLLQSFKAILQAKGQGSAQDNINMGTFEKLKFPFPPIDQQKEIVSSLDSLTASVQQLETVYSNKLLAIDELKKSILQKAFSGELTKDSKGVAA